MSQQQNPNEIFENLEYGEDGRPVFKDSFRDENQHQMNGNDQKLESPEKIPNEVSHISSHQKEIHNSDNNSPNKMNNNQQEQNQHDNKQQSQQYLVENYSDEQFNDDMGVEMSQNEANFKQLVSRYPVGQDQKIENNPLVQDSARRAERVGEIQINSNKKLNYNNNIFTTIDLEGTEMNFNLNQGQCFPLISTEQKGDQIDFVFNRDILREILELKNKVAFVSVVGPKKTGKTFLLNQLIQANQEISKFSSKKLNNSISEINIWTHPLYNKITNTFYYFLDFNNSQEGNSQGDKKMMWLLNLISSTLIVNLKGPFDQFFLKPLQYMSNVKGFVKMTSNENRDELLNAIPVSIFAIRDVTLPLEKGQKPAGAQFINKYLNDEKFFKKTDLQLLKIRKRVIKYFQIKDSITINNPVSHNITYKENNKSSARADFTNERFEISGLRNKEFNDEFFVDLKNLRKKIVTHTKVQSLRSVPIGGLGMVNFITSLVEDLNQGEKFNLSQSFSYFAEHEFAEFYNYLIDMYNEHITQRFQDGQYMSVTELIISLNYAKNNVMDAFTKLKQYDSQYGQFMYSDTLDKLKAQIADMEIEIIKTNAVLASEFCINYLYEQKAVVTQLTSNAIFRIDDLKTIASKYKQILLLVKDHYLGGNDMFSTFSEIIEQYQSDLTQLFYNEISEIKDQTMSDAVQLKSEIADVSKKNKDLLKTEEDKKRLEVEKDEHEKKITLLQKDLAELQQRLTEVTQQRDTYKKKQAQCC